MNAGDQAAVLNCIAKAKVRCGLGPQAKVHTCYEAGRDGWWLHRWLCEQRIDSIVVDSASIEVNRRAKRAKTDRLDADKLLALLLRYHRGERRVWSVLREPTAQEEDARRTHRELARLMLERTAHTNRISSLLVLHNLRPGRIGGRNWQNWWDGHCALVPPLLRIEIEREIARLALVKEQIRALEATRRQQVAEGTHPVVAQLARLRAIGLKGAWILDKELFGWRRFANRRQLAGCLGLAPTAYASGDSQVEQGISKAGNQRARTLLVELAWRWLTLQPQSALSQWFNQRFGIAGKRSRRVGIVALARRLAIALWRFIEHGQIPAGATLKPVRD
jgi:transposase